MIYLVFFAISFIFIYLSNKYKDNKKIRILFELAAITVLAILSGMRNIEVGTDLKNYVSPIFYAIKTGGLFNNYFFSKIEIGYLLLNYIVLLFTNKFGVLLFIIQFLTLFFTYYGIKNICKEHYLLGFMVFSIMYYNLSLNLVRQFISIAMLFYSLKYIFGEKRNVKLFIAFVFAAFLFHKTSLLFLLVLPIEKYTRTHNLERKKIVLHAITLIALGVAGLLLFPTILSSLVEIGIIDDKYLYYLTHNVNSTLNIESLNIIIDIIALTIIVLNNKKEKFKNKATLNSFYYFLLLDIIMLVIGAKYEVVGRLGLYFRIPAIVYIMSNLPSMLAPENESNKIYLQRCAMIILFCLFYWYYIYWFGGSGQTIPYYFARIINWGIFL